MVFSFCREVTRSIVAVGVLMSATISNHGCAARGGSSHARKHSTMVASTLIQRVPGMLPVQVMRLLLAGGPTSQADPGRSLLPPRPAAGRSFGIVSRVAA